MVDRRQDKKKKKIVSYKFHVDYYVTIYVLVTDTSIICIVTSVYKKLIIKAVVTLTVLKIRTKVSYLNMTRVWD